MKQKKLNKKLVLNKKTIAHLADDVLNSARGGFTNDTCESCYDYTYCWGCPTLICPDIRDTALVVCDPFHHTDFYTCAETPSQCC